MARKKIVFVIVEGVSDAYALDVVISRIFDQDTVYVHIVHGDITSDKDTTTSNIISKLTDEIKEYAKSNHFEKNKKAFFKEIIHIVDTDGSYISDDKIIKDETKERPFYSENEIRTCNKSGIERRNYRKRMNLNKLSTVSEIWGIPYSVYYMSCNLDHVLYNKLNSTDEQKEADSFAFAKRYKDKTDEFLRFISDSDFSVTTGYKESWDYIKRDLHSLERHTNLGLCFVDNECNEVQQTNELTTI